MDSIANPHLNDEPGTIITFLDEMFGLALLLDETVFGAVGILVIEVVAHLIHAMIRSAHP